jgi:site-specific DNA-cytosine methylase
MKPKLFELFKGSGSVGKVARKVGYEVISIDFDPIYTPDIETDILYWDYKKYSKDNNFIPDYIWASPPCGTFTSMVYPLKERDPITAEGISERAKTGTKILHRTLEIISYYKKINPNLLYCIENPRGMMRKDKKMIAQPYMSTTYYCYYGDIKLKATNFWSNYPLGLKEINDKCKKYIGVQDIKDIKDRYSIPSKLVKQIIFNAL